MYIFILNVFVDRNCLTPQEERVAFSFGTGEVLLNLYINDIPQNDIIFYIVK
jgi:hypothetical protein